MVRFQRCHARRDSGPGLWPFGYGITVLCASLPVIALQVHAGYRVQTGSDSHVRWRFLTSVPGFIPLGCYVAAGVMLITEHPAGMLFTAIGALTAIAAALLISWIALIEVLR